jgi:hypothetical protein
MTEQPFSIIKRLQLIDQYLMFRGQIGRSDLIKHFDVGIATASRTLKEYRSLYPGNIEYSVSDRLYVASPQFHAAYEHDVDKALSLIAYGLDIREVEGARFGYPNPMPFVAPLKGSVISSITRAMIKKEAVKVEYASGSSGGSTRILAPNALFQGGGAWYVRAFDTQNDGFRTFRLSRIKSVGTSFKADREWGAEFDGEWRQALTLTLGPHPARENQSALREDLGLTDKPVKNIHVNAATAGFILIDLRVDCSEGGILNPYEYHLRLMNRHELVGVSSMNISPGFKLSVQQSST